MTCVSLHGGAGFSCARETRSIVAALLFCVDETDCMTLLSDQYSSSKEISLSRSDLIQELGAANRILSAEGGDAWASIASACRAYGLRAIDGPYANYGDPAGFRAGAERASALGCEDKWASTLRRSRWCTRYLYRLRRNSPGVKASSVPLRWQPKPGSAAVSRDGALIDMALEKIARSLIERAEVVSRTGTPTLQTGATDVG